MMKKLLRTIVILLIVGGVGALSYHLIKVAYSVSLEDDIDMNEKINFEDMVESGEAKNKDYSNSVFYPYYELLNDNQKVIYDDLLTGIKSYQESITPSTTITKDEVKDAFYAIIYEHPELFWLDNHYSCEYYDETLEVASFKVSYTDVINNIEEAKKSFDDVVDNIVKNAKNYELDYAKEKYVHDTLINVIDYSKDTLNHQSAYDALVNRKAVCAGYTKAFQLIMTKLGIPTYYITGISTEDHAWNLIELEDGFYNIDLTFDDQDSRIIYRYFNIPDDLIKKDHTRTGLSEQIIKADGFKYTNIYTTLIE